MSEASFTPGPWKAITDDFGHIHGDAYCAIDDGRKAIAYVMLLDRPNRRGISEWRDNAHLLAAAPEMFAALEPFAEVYEDACDETDKDDRSLWDHAASMGIKIADLRAACAALAKARGETP
jgi:hypothetical protein